MSPIEPKLQVSGKIGAHLHLVSSFSAALTSPVCSLSRMPYGLWSRYTLPESLVLSVHLHFAHLARSSLSHLSSKVSSKRPFTCSMPITGAGGGPLRSLSQTFSLPCPSQSDLIWVCGAHTTTFIRPLKTSLLPATRVFLLWH